MIATRALENSPVVELERADHKALKRAARLLEGIIFYSLLALIILTTIPYGASREWWIAPSQCAVFALAALWVVEGLLGGRWLVLEHKLLVPLVPLLAFIFLQTVPLGEAEVGGVRVWRTLSADAYETRLVAFRFLALILFAALLLRYTSTRRRLRALIFVVLFVALASAVFGVVRQAAHHDGDGFVLPRLQPQLGYGQFINPNHFALLMEMALGLLLGLMTERGARRRGLRLFLCLTAGVWVWSALVLSNSRGGIFGLLGEILFFALLFRASRRSREGMRGDAPAGSSRSVKNLLLKSALVMALLLGVGVGVVWMGGDPLVRRMEGLRMEVGAEGAGNRAFPRRLEMWQATWRMIEDHPFAGTGFGAYWQAINGYYDASGTSAPQQAHNEYLELVAGGGLVALALAAWFVAGLVKRARQCLRARHPFRRAACLGALAGLCAAAIHSFVDFGLHVTINALVFTSLVVIATAHVRSGEHGPEVEKARRPSQPGGVSHAERRPPAARRRAISLVSAAVSLIVFPIAIRESARAGLSRWYSMSHEREYSLSSAERAVSLSPSDPSARFFRAGLLSLESRDQESVEEFERAAALRPRDFLLWINLGLVRDARGDPAGAVAAFEEAARLAPYYAQPRWQLGSALLRAGERERAAAELSRAAASDPGLLQPTLELLWDALGGDADAMTKAVSSQPPAAMVSLAQFFKERGKIAEAIGLLRRAGPAADAERRKLTAELISAKRFQEAYELWSGGRGSADSGAITDGNFEGDVDFTEAGFGWQVTSNKEGLLASLDAEEEPRAGSRSLRLDFKGKLPTKSPIISQLVLVKANARYRLSFAARTQELITAGAPAVAVIDAGSGLKLGQSAPLRCGSSGWQDHTVGFTTNKSTTVMMIAIQRQNCAKPPCLIFGRVWLDNFSLQQL